MEEKDEIRDSKNNPVKRTAGCFGRIGIRIVAGAWDVGALGALSSAAFADAVSSACPAAAASCGGGTSGTCLAGVIHYLGPSLAHCNRIAHRLSTMNTGQV